MPAISGCNLEEVCHERGLGLHATTANVVNLSLPDHRHRLIASQCSSGRRQASETEPKPHQPLYSAMILLDNVC
jgi:hypothetical protein